MLYIAIQIVSKLPKLILLLTLNIRLKQILHSVKVFNFWCLLFICFLLFHLFFCLYFDVIKLIGGAERQILSKGRKFITTLSIKYALYGMELVKSWFFLI